VEGQRLIVSRRAVLAGTSLAAVSTLLSPAMALAARDGQDGLRAGQPISSRFVSGTDALMPICAPEFPCALEQAPALSRRMLSVRHVYPGSFHEPAPPLRPNSGSTRTVYNPGTLSWPLVGLNGICQRP
jgi:hypothetical protein